jgi:hypothetical protein
MCHSLKRTACLVLLLWQPQCHEVLDFITYQVGAIDFQKLQEVRSSGKPTFTTLSSPLSFGC